MSVRKQVTAYLEMRIGQMEAALSEFLSAGKQSDKVGAVYAHLAQAANVMAMNIAEAEHEINDAAWLLREMGALPPAEGE